MKNFKTTVWLSVFIVMVMANVGWGQTLLLNENFSYTLGTDLSANGWGIQGVATPTVSVTASTITYPGYLSSGIGLETSLATSGQDVNKTFTSQTSGTIYASCLVNVTSATTTGDYFFHLGPSTIGTSFHGRVYVKRDASNNLSFGISRAGAVATAIFTPFSYALNTTYLLVLKYTIVAGATNDISAIYINPTLNSVEPVTGWTISTDTPTDLANIGSVALRQGSSSNAAALKLDGIRVATTWADIVGTVGGSSPSISTTAVTSIQSTGATFNGNITSDGGSSITDRGFCYKTSNGVTLLDNLTSEGGTTTGSYFKAFTLSPETNYFYRAYATNGIGTTLSSTEISFWTLSTEPSAHSSTFSSTAISQTQIDLTFSAASTITNADGYIILQKTGSAPTGLPSDGGAYTVENTIGDGKVAAIINNTSTTSANITGLSAGTQYYFTILPYNYNGSNNETYNYKTDGSVPVTNSTTNPPNDVDSYVNAPAVQVNPLTVSSLYDTDPEAVEVFKFNINDVGTDGLETIVTQIKINAGTNNIANWSNTIQGAKLSVDGGGSFVTTGTTVIIANSITFPISSGDLNISNGSSIEISLFIFLKSSGLTDNQVIEFTIPKASHGFTADATGSTFATDFPDVVNSNKMSVDVVATKLLFVQQPTNTNINVAMAPAVTIEATDVNNNRDLDKTGTVSITSSGTLNSSPQTSAFSSGVATFSSLNHTATGTGLILTASSTSYSDITSNTFNIIIEAAGILLFEENFNYTSGTTLTSNGWSAHSGSGTNPISVNTSGLSYNNYGSTGIGNSAIINANGEDVNKVFTQRDPGSTTYCSFLVNVTSATTGGDYIVHLAPTTPGTEFRGRFYVKDVSGNLQFGISSTGNVATVSYSPTNYSFGINYLIVIKHYYTTTTQTSSLFINPSVVSEPASPDATETYASSSTNIGSVEIRQSSATNVAVIDGIRIGTGWGAVLGNPQYDVASSTIASGNYNNVTMVSNDLSLTGNVTVNGTLTLTNGIINSTALNKLTLGTGATISGGSATSFVSGPLAKICNTASEFTFHVGKGSSYLPIGITTTNASSNTFEAEYFNTAYSDTSTFGASGLVSVSHSGYHELTRTGTTPVYLTLYWDANSGVTTTADLKVAHWNTTNSEWDNLGASNITGNTTSGHLQTLNTVTSFSPFALASISNQPMPVTLSSLNSSIIGRNIKLNWTTASEINNSGFNVERMNVADNNWSKVTFVSGHGTVNTPTNYSFEDRNLQTGKYKYRLKQIDVNGNFEYFALNGEVEIGVPKKFDLSQNYPNPFNPVTKINFDLPVNGLVNLRLYDMLGREVATLVNEVRTAGYYTVNFDASKLASGIYFYRLNAGSFSGIKKMAVIK